MSNGAYYESPPVGSGDYSDTSWYDWQTPLHDVYDPFIDWPSPLQQPEYPASRYSGIGGDPYQPIYEGPDFLPPQQFYDFPPIEPPRTSYPSQPVPYDPFPELPWWLYDTGQAPYIQSPSVSAAQPLPVSQAGLPWIPDEMLDPSLQPPEPDYPLSPVSGLPYIPDYMLDPRLQPPAAKEPGILENIGDFLGNVGDFLWDTGKYVLENVDLSGGKSQPLPQGVSVTTPVYQPQYTTAADRTGAQEYVRLVSQGQVTGTTAPSLGPARAGLDLSSISPNVLLIGGGVLLLLLSTRK